MAIFSKPASPCSTPRAPPPTFTTATSAGAASMERPLVPGTTEGVLVYTVPPSTPATPKMYGVRIGRRPGVYRSWSDAHAQVSGYPHQCHQKFGTFDESAAFVWGLDWADRGPWYFVPLGNREDDTFLASLVDPRRTSDDMPPLSTVSDSDGSDIEVIDPDSERYKEAFRTQYNTAITAAAMDPPPTHSPWAASSLQMYPKVARVLPGSARRPPVSVDTPTASVAPSSSCGFTDAPTSLPDDSGISTPVELAFDGISAGLASLRMPDPSRRSLVIPPGLEVNNNTSSLSETVVHGLDKMRFDYLAVKIIAAAKKASYNSVDFKHYLMAAGMEEYEVREVYADIKTYPA